jgi:hypothetical protein
MLAGFGGHVAEVLEATGRQAMHDHRQQDGGQF